MKDRRDAQPGWLSLVPLMAGTFVVAVESSILTGVLPRVSADLGVSTARGGQALALYPLVYVFGAPTMAVLMGGRSQRGVCTIGLLVFAAGNLVTARAPSISVLVAGRLVAAVGASCYTPNAGARAAALGADKRGRALSVLASGLTMATIVGAPMGVWASAFVTWRQILIAVASLAIAVAWIQRLSRLRGGQVAAMGMRARLRFLRGPKLLSIVGLSFAVVCGEFLVYTYLSVIVAHAVGQGSAMVAGALLVFGIGTTLGTVVGGACVDGLGWPRVLPLSMFGICATLAMIPLAHQRFVLYPVLLVWGVTGWSFTPAQTVRLFEAFPDNGPLLITFNASAVSLGVSVGGFVGGFTLIAVGAHAQPFLGSTLVAGALAAYLVSRRTRPPADARRQTVSHTTSH